MYFLIVNLVAFTLVSCHDADSDSFVSKQHSLHQIKFKPDLFQEVGNLFNGNHHVVIPPPAIPLSGRPSQLPTTSSSASPSTGPWSAPVKLYIHIYNLMGFLQKGHLRVSPFKTVYIRISPFIRFIFRTFSTCN